MDDQSTIGFIGAGHMGGALIRGLAARGPEAASRIVVSDMSSAALDQLSGEFPGLRTTGNNAEAAGCSFLVLAVKPHVYKPVIQNISGKIPPDTLVVSIAAGLTAETVASYFGRDVKVIRTMPNTPALVGAGMTAVCPGQGVSDTEARAVADLFEAVGETVFLPDRLMDAYTSLAGSSPAWVFMFLEALADGAVRDGLPRDQALRIAAQAVYGASKLAADTGTHPAVLKDGVCSPGGTTIEAVASLERSGFRSAIMEAMRACTLRASEMGTQ